MSRLSQETLQDGPIGAGEGSIDRAAGEPIEAMYEPSRGKDCDFDDTDPAEAAADFKRFHDEWTRAYAAVAGLAFDGRTPR